MWKSVAQHRGASQLMRDKTLASYSTIATDAPCGGSSPSPPLCSLDEARGDADADDSGEHVGLRPVARTVELELLQDVGADAPSRKDTGMPAIDGELGLLLLL